MTIIYQYRVASTSLGGFLKLLKAWKGSVYQLLYKELFIFLTVYAGISLVYRFALTEDQRVFFETIVIDLHNSTSAIPLSFVLGFYVTFIVQRWWQQFNNVPWPDRTLFTMSAYLHGFDDRARMMRRSVARYMMFGLIWICRGISVAVMKRFPTLDHIVDAGFITKEEKVMFENTECKYQKFFVPLMWANQILVTARRENKIETEFGLRMIMEPLADFRDKCSLCFVYDWITVPLVYTQVVTFAVYSYFAVSLFGQQYLDPAKNYKAFELDFYIPGFTILQFLFYMGWLKVAEQMINPFGEDDDDFDINWLLDRHTAVAFALVDQCYGKYPSLVRDGFWNDVAPDIPYTESSAKSMRPNFLGSTFNIAPSHQESEKLILREHDYINQHDWLQRHRGKDSIYGSLLSLYPFRNTRQQGDSQSTLGSNGSVHGRSLHHGKMYCYVLNKGEDTESRTRWSSVEIPVTDSSFEDDEDKFELRERANTDSDFRVVNKERKLSLPFIINPFSKNKQKRLDMAPATSSLKTTRFTVEPVKEASVATTESNSVTKTRRTGHSSIPFQNVVSRIPMLSAISESCTVTSLSQLMNPPSLTEDKDLDDVFEQNTENSVLPYVDIVYEDDLAFVDETSPCMAKEKTNTLPSLSTKVSNTSPTKTTSSLQSLKTTSKETSAQPETAVTPGSTQATTARNRKISTSTCDSRPTKPPVHSMDKSVPAKVTKKEPTETSVTAPKVTMLTTTTANSPLVSVRKEKIESKEVQQSNHNSLKSQPISKTSLAPLIAFEEC